LKAHEATREGEIDDKPDNSTLFSEVADGVTRNGLGNRVRLLREPDAQICKSGSTSAGWKRKNAFRVSSIAHVWSANVRTAVLQMGRGRGAKKERGDCSPLSAVTKANSLPSVLPFYRKKPTATKFRRVVPWFALRRPPSLGLNRLRNANTGLNPAELRHDCHLLPCLAEAFHPPPSRVARQVFACRATQDQFVWSASTTRF
jgi:hypothetical protein